jgi:hypothetical protein
MLKRSLIGAAAATASMMIVFLTSNPPAWADRANVSNLTIVKVIDVSSPSLLPDGSSGPTVTVNGLLHLVTEPVVLSDGTAIGPRLKTNLSDATAVIPDGTATYVAVGAFDAIPTDCEPQPCLPSSWTVMFRLVLKTPSPGGPVPIPYPNLVLPLTVNTVYDAGGHLVGACVVGQDDCGSEIIP